MIKKFKKSIKELIADSKLEIKETKRLTKLIWASKNRQLTKEEIEMIKDQSLDIFRALFLSALFIIPGSGFIIVFLVKGGKRLGMRLLPSAFVKKK